MAGRKPTPKPQWRVNPQAPQRLQELERCVSCDANRRGANCANDQYRNVALCRDAEAAKRILALIEIAEGKGAL